jgi:pimeloyl-ACP methyl ester carboxylesterase
MPPPEPKVHVAADGVEIAYEEWNHSGAPLVCLVHATGFCKELAEPVVAELAALTGGFRAIAIDQRAHGDSGTPAPPFDWWDIGRDLVEVVDDAAPVVGAGHSAGGAALVLAELLRPGTFAALVLVEPIIFPPPYFRDPDNPMARLARKRRDVFAGRNAAYENWRSKEPFSSWDDRALRAYVTGGLRDDGAGEVTLKCSKAAEAEFFIAATAHAAWDRLGEVAAPTLILAGERSTTHQEPFARELASRMPRARYEIIPGASHFLWMERPALVAARVAEALQSVRPS